MFHKTATKLAGLYLAILMSISLFFSVVVYQQSVTEYDRSFRGPGAIIQREPDFDIGNNLHTQLLRIEELRFKEAKQRILARLVIINLLILVGAGFISYYLARRTIQPIEEAHEALERFTADASHELRTPIAAMQAETEVALMNPTLTLAAAKTQLHSNLEELAKLTQLSEGLLRLARLENDDQNWRELKVDKLIQAAINRVVPLAEKKSILLKAESTGNLSVFGDEDSLQEALVILLDNAVKYSPEKTEVTITAKKEAKVVALTVKDRGIGIKASELPHVYDRFYRADSARSKQSSNGHGLGLAIAKNITELHKGSLSAKSRIGQGSTFTIRLPQA